MKRFYTITLVLISDLLVASCTFAAADENTSKLEQTEATGKMRVGIRFDNPPLSYVDTDGNWVGFDVDLANALAKKMGLEIEQIRVDETTRISFLQEDKIDLAVASMNHTRSRDEAVDFSLTYFWDNQSFLVRKGTYNNIDELMGKKVAANAGSSVIPSWQEYSAGAGGPEPEIVEFTDKLAAMQALRDGAVEGYSEDNITLLALAAGDPNLELLPGGHNPVQFGIGLPENDSQWRDAVNLALQELWKDGTYEQIYNEWFGPGADIELPLGGQIEVWPE